MNSQLSSLPNYVLQLSFGYCLWNSLTRKTGLRFLLIREAEADQVKIRERSPEERQSNWYTRSRVNGERTSGADVHVVWVESQWH